MIIGICGNSGSGKSTVAKEIIKKYNNAIHCDIDEIGHNSLKDKEVKENLIKYFGEGIVSDDGNIDRKKLGNIVFNSKTEMDKLTEITWQYMQTEIDNMLKKSEAKTIVLDWILLPDTKYFKMCDITILLDIPYKTRFERVKVRDNITEETFKIREKAKKTYNGTDFTYVIKNESIEEIKKVIALI